MQIGGYVRGLLSVSRLRSVIRVSAGGIRHNAEIIYDAVLARRAASLQGVSYQPHEAILTDVDDHVELARPHQPCADLRTLHRMHPERRDGQVLHDSDQLGSKLVGLGLDVSALALG